MNQLPLVEPKRPLYELLLKRKTTRYRAVFRTLRLLNPGGVQAVCLRPKCPTMTEEFKCVMCVAMRSTNLKYRAGIS